MDRPSQAIIQQRALGIVEETMAYPTQARERLLDLKRGAIELLVADTAKNAEVMEKYYPGWTDEDLKAMLALLPKGKTDSWHL